MSAVLAMVSVAVMAFGHQDTDTTFAVSPSARLDLNVLRGDVVIRTWSRSEIQIVADLSRSERLDVSNSGSTVRIRLRSSRGIPDGDMEITIPATMSLDMNGTFLEVDARGVQGNVSIVTVQGDVYLDGGRERVYVESVQGDLDVVGAEGRIELKSGNGDVTLSHASGEVRVETINGEITLDRVNATSVRATTVNGDVDYDGSVASTGRYTFTTHNGDITLRIGGNLSATFSVSTFSGEFESDFPVTLTETLSQGKRFKFVLGDGEAQFELSSFGGTIRLTRPR